ncbi:hypothetical protein YSA_09966 [Pseudomonas putida ND6]|uniref:Uncharacterized protein n=1 Tax=Pseudomonas putida ND6 TaxID=231023 RepID=I3V360_PSEPU|nr:hypothetical protein YSA_09966 [Pseudomonas putida ND6]
MALRLPSAGFLDIFRYSITVFLEKGPAQLKAMVALQ